MELIKEPRAIVIQYNGTEAPLGVLQTINDVLNNTCSYSEIDIQQFSSEDISKILLKNSKTNIVIEPIAEENPIASALETIITKYGLDLSKMKNSEIIANLIKKLISTKGDADNDLVHAVYIIGMDENIDSTILSAFGINREKILAIRQAFKLSSYL